MRKAFVMQLKPGFEAEYKRCHDEIWPELVALLKAYGIADYHIFLHPRTLQLFGIFEVPESFDDRGLKREPVMLRWWQSMSPLMETLADSDEPQAIPLIPTFYLE